MSEQVTVQGKPKVPSVLISYAHETPVHASWVLALAQDLRKNGINVILDQWDLTPGRDTLVFMEQSITVADRVLMLCTPKYAAKADKRVGGVGYEGMIISAELFTMSDTNKFVCLLRNGEPETSLPVFVKSRFYIDFRDDGHYQTNLQRLLRDLHEVPPSDKPPLGPNPYSDTSSLGKVEQTGHQYYQTLLDKAQILLRDRDQGGWNRLLRSTQQDVAALLLKWTKEVAGARLDDASWQERLDGLVVQAVPMMGLTLCAVDSGAESVGLQASTVDWLLRLPGWPMAGESRLVWAPRFLVYIYHHLLGSLLFDQRKQPQAVRLLRMQVPDWQTDAVTDMWASADLMAWPVSLDDWVQAWQFLLDRYAQPNAWLERVFASEMDYQLGVGAYQMLASILDFASQVGAGTHPEDFNLRVAPTFFLRKKSDAELPDLGQMFRRALPDAQATQAIATEFGVDRTLLDRYWKFWVDHWVDFIGRSSFRNLAWLAPQLRQSVARLP